MEQKMSLEKVTTVLFKKLAEAGLSGEAEFSKAEWHGIRPLLPKSFDTNGYVKCATKLTPIILEKFSSKGTDPHLSTNIPGEWVYADGVQHWVVRPGTSSEHVIEL